MTNHPVAGADPVNPTALKTTETPHRIIGADTIADGQTVLRLRKTKRAEKRCQVEAPSPSLTATAAQSLPPGQPQVRPGGTDSQDG